VSGELAFPAALAAVILVARELPMVATTASIVTVEERRDVNHDGLVVVGDAELASCGTGIIVVVDDEQPVVVEHQHELLRAGYFAWGSSDVGSRS
jgi:hypothetical protein